MLRQKGVAWRNKYMSKEPKANTCKATVHPVMTTVKTRAESSKIEINVGDKWDESINKNSCPNLTI